MNKKLKKSLLLVLTYALVAVLAIGGTLAYLTSTDSDVNVMTLGNVKIAQHEYQRVQNDDGTYVTDTIDDKTSYVLEAFEQGKALLPATDPINNGAGSWDSTTVRMSQVDSYGGMQVFVNSNAQDKFVTVENTGKTDAYVRTLVAIECGDGDASLIGASFHNAWTSNAVGKITVDGNNYYVFEYLYKGAQLSDGSWRHGNGILPAGDTSYPNLSQVYLKSAATNEDCQELDGNDNGTLDILVLSQAVQADGFDNAQTALDEAFGTAVANAQTWFAGDEFEAPAVVNTAEELRDALAAGEDVILTESVEVEVNETAPYGNKYGLAQNGGVINGNGETITFDAYGDDYGIMTSGGTIKNLTLENVARGIMIMSPTEDVIIDNVVIKNDVLYPMNTGEHAALDGIDLIVSNSTFGGWTSFAGIETASFTKCDFVNGNYGYGWPYDCLVKPYVNTTFTECTFADKYYLDLSALGADCKVTLMNCTVNGQALTADICGTECDGTETFCVELPAGRTLEDCVIFK